MMRPCPSFHGYSATDAGNIISHRKRVGRTWVVDPDYVKPMKGYVASHGYLVVGVYGGAKFRVIQSYVLVADAFHGPRPEGLMTRHLDGDKTNNAPSNLKYGTAKENSEDAIRHGTRPKGCRGPNSKFEDSEVRMLRDQYVNGRAIEDICFEYGLQEFSVMRMLLGSTYSHVR